MSPDKRLLSVLLLLAFLLGGLALLNSSAFAATLDSWVWRNPLPQSNNLRGEVYGQGMFVSVGEYGTIVTSRDGNSWAVRASGIADNLNGVAIGNNGFVAVGDNGKIVTSSDGATWTQQTSNTANILNSVSFANGLYVAVGESGTVVTSPDSVVWTVLTSPANTPNNTDYLTGVTHGASGGFVAVGTHTIWTSSDAVSWASQARPNEWLDAITYGNGLYVATGKAFGGVASILTSPDGTSWTSRTPNTSNELFGVTCGASGFVAVGYGGTIVTSSSGTSWAPEASGTTKNLRGVAYGSGTYSAAGDYGVILASSNAVSWNGKSSGYTGSNINSAAYGGNGYVAVGTYGSVFNSADGAVWIYTTVGAAEHRDVAYLNGLYVITDYDGTVWTSSDGSAFTHYTGTGTTWPLNGVAYGNGTYVAVANNGDVVTSTDGIAWAKSVQVAGAQFNAVTFGNGLFVAVGTWGYIHTSPNGITWTQRTSNTSNYLYGVTYGAGVGKFVAGGWGGTIVTSGDGITWSAQQFPASVPDQYQSVVYGPSGFVAVSNLGTMVKSTDGVTWTSIPLWGDYASFNGAVYDATNDQYLAVGFAGAILQTGGQLEVFKADAGTGTVTSDIGGINCGTACAASYSASKVVTLTASWGAGTSFTGWSGCVPSTTTNPITVTMDAHKSCIATFIDTPPVNGVCGSSNGASFNVAPVAGFCSTGTATAVTGNGPWSWSCNGTNGGGNASCSANLSPPPVNGVCGSSNGASFSIAPVAGLCSTGTATAVTGNGPWSWSCDGANGGANATCGATMQSYGITFLSGGNGILTGNVNQTVTYNGSATQVAAVPAAGYHFVNWTGNGGFAVSASNPLTVSNVTSNLNITANFAIDPVNGVCGSSNGVIFTIAPSTNLCSAGNTSSVTGAGPWSWSCNGANGGTNASCSANLQRYTVTPDAGAGGGITPATVQTVPYNTSAGFTVTPDSGYTIATVTGCNGSLSANTYTTGAITGNCLISATFAPVAAPPPPPALSLTTSTLNNGVYGARYSQSLLARGGTAPYTWSVVGGTLPPGLILSGDTISGTPAQGGSFSFTLQVKDSAVSPATACREFSITIDKAILTVTATSMTRPPGFANPDFTATYTGFINDDTVSVLSGTSAFTTTATTESPAGSYDIIISQGTLDSPNYCFTFVNGILSVSEMTTDSLGKTTVPIALTASPGSQVTIAAGTLLTDAEGNPVSGPFTMASTPMGSMTALPQGASAGHSGETSLVALGASIDLNLSAGGVKITKIDPPMVVKVVIPSTFATPGTGVDYYSFDGTNWNKENKNGSVNVEADGTVDMSVGHLSIWAVAKFQKLPSGKIALNSTTTDPVTVADALRALQIAVGMTEPTANDLAEGDVAPLVNGRPAPNKAINVGDAIVILQKSLGVVGW